jgi:hypothetical protein
MHERPALEQPFVEWGAQLGYLGFALLPAVDFFE